MDDRPKDPVDPRLDTRPPTPEEELEIADLAVRQAAIDEELTMFDPREPPRPVRDAGDRSEPVADENGVEVDIQRDTPTVDPVGVPELTLKGLRDVDVV